MSGRGRPARPARPDGMAARAVAATALIRIEADGAYANLVLPGLLARSGLDDRDRRFATELAYGATRMRRACDWLVDRFVLTDLDVTARSFLRLGAYQLAFLDTPPHAAVNATVAAAPGRLRGLVNAVLRRVAEAPRPWPSDAVRLSYPDWVFDTLVADLGDDDARAAMTVMNEAAAATERDDGYVQDRASQWVAEAVAAGPGERVLDLCAAPGGKATWLAGAGAGVVAADVRPARVRLIAGNVARLGLGDRVAVMAQDGTRPALRAGSFDRVLVDAPCSGLGSLRRRPDARWRIGRADVDSLVELQRDLVAAALPLLRPGGVLVYSACTLTRAETAGLDEHLAATAPDLTALAPPGAPWRPLGRGALLLPQDAGTDGMYLLRLGTRPRGSVP
jgi:16S rRNA (cytosine967-C5)-methyltransferase